MDDPTALRAALAIGESYESELTEDQRKLGAHYTPPDVAELLVGAAFDHWFDAVGVLAAPPRVCDPACGGGVLLVAAADRLLAAGASPSVIVVELLVGFDTDPGAVRAATGALRSWASGHGVVATSPRVSVADALGRDDAGDDRFDLVVGNPPFQNQLGARTARSAGDRARLQERFGVDRLGYADTAALFQLLGLELLVEGGVLALIQPQSFLVARDCAPVRDALIERGELLSVWIPGTQVFRASVDVCATFTRRPRAHAPARGTVRVFGRRDGSVDHGSISIAALNGPTWSSVWAQAREVPTVPARSERSSVGPSKSTGSGAVLGDVATATAGFRDQYYGLLDHLRTDRPASGAKLATTAMIDPGRCDWDSRQVTIARHRWTAPWVDLDALAAIDERLSRWVDAQLRPKVLVATQTKVIEAVLDASGEFVPMTPLIAVTPRPAATDSGPEPLGPEHLEAALLAPAATVWGLRTYGGAGLSAGGLRIAARQLLELPLPHEREPWDAAVALLAERRRRAEPGAEPGARGTGPGDVGSSADAPAGGFWSQFGALMNASWGFDDPSLVEWWRVRIPPVRTQPDPRRYAEPTS